MNDQKTPSKNSEASKEFKMSKGLAKILTDWKIVPLNDIVDYVNKTPLTLHEKDNIVKNSEHMLANIYPCQHILKNKLNVDLKKEIESISRQAAQKSNMCFHQDLMKLFRNVHDYNVRYDCGEEMGFPFSFLGFFITESFNEDKSPAYIVSEILDDSLRTEEFKDGAEIISIDGNPVKTLAMELSKLCYYTNDDCKLKEGLRMLTFRDLSQTNPPNSKQSVTVEFKPEASTSPAKKEYSLTDINLAKVPREKKINWKFYIKNVPKKNEKCEDEKSVFVLNQVFKTALGIGIVGESIKLKKEKSNPSSTADIVSINKVLSEIQKHAFVKKMVSSKTLTNVILNDIDNLKLFASCHQSYSKPFGYIKLFGFNSFGDMMHSFTIMQMFQSFPKNGLVVDLRGAVSGTISEMFKFLEFISKIPSITVFSENNVNKHVALDIGKKKDMSAQDKEITRAANAGEGHTAPIGTTYSRTNLQLYKGPIVVLTDVFSSSVSELFAALVMDHKIGTVLGVDARTNGSPGTPRYSTEIDKLMNKTQNPLPRTIKISVPLEKSYTMSPIPSGSHPKVVSIGRSIQYTGLEPEKKHLTTRRDIMSCDFDLFQHIAATYIKTDNTRYMEV